MGQGNNASWPVGGATRQSGGNWVGRFEKPEDWSIWASMYSSNLELGQLITVGDSILKWTAAGVKFVDAAFATQADLDSFCSKLGTTIAPSSTASVNGVQYTYVDGGWVAVGGGDRIFNSFDELENSDASSGVVFEPCYGGVGIKYTRNDYLSTFLPSVGDVFPSRKNIVFVNMGQSNEVGSFKRFRTGTLPVPVRFRNSRYSDSINYAMPKVRRQGSYLPIWDDIMSSCGINADIINNAIGSASLRYNTVGIRWNLDIWGANSVVYGKRTAVSIGDRGDKGDFFRVGAKLFQATTGTKRYCMVNDPTTPLSLYGGASLYNELDYIVFDTPLTTGATQPNWGTAVNINDTIADGGIVWTLVSTTFSPDATYGYIARPTDPYWDPLGIIARAVDAASAYTSMYYTKVAHWSNGQSDTNSSPSNYAAVASIYAKAAMSLATYLTSLGWIVYLGNSSGVPGETPLASGAYAGYYPSQLAQVGMNIAMSTYFAGSTTVFRGADLFEKFGPTPSTYPESGTSGTGPHLEVTHAGAFAHAIAKAMLSTSPFA